MVLPGWSHHRANTTYYCTLSSHSVPTIHSFKCMYTYILAPLCLKYLYLYVCYLTMYISMYVISDTGPFLIRTVPFVETCSTTYGPSLGAAIFWTLPGNSRRTLSSTLYACGIRIRFSRVLDWFIRSCFLKAIEAQLALNWIGKIISRPNTSSPGVAFSVEAWCGTYYVWHMPWP